MANRVCQPALLVAFDYTDMASDQNKQGPGKFRPGLLTKAKMLWDQFLAQPAVPHDVGKPVRQADWAIGSCGRQANDRYLRKAVVAETGVMQPAIETISAEHELP